MVKELTGVGKWLRTGQEEVRVKELTEVGKRLRS